MVDFLTGLGALGLIVLGVLAIHRYNPVARRKRRERKLYKQFEEALKRYYRL